MSETNPKSPFHFAIDGLQLLEQIGDGSQGLVYKAQLHDRLVVIKVQKTNAHEKLGGRLSFFREAAFLASLNHPNLPQVIDVGEVSGQAYLIESFIEGRPLIDLIQNQSLSLSQIHQIAKDLAKCLVQVHRSGFVHRDIKPKNILIDANYHAHLIDFGLATEQHIKASDEGMAGTLTYCSPEQSGILNRPVDQRSDLYSLGITIYECVAGAAPFRAQDPGELIQKHAQSEAEPLIKIKPSVSPLLTKIVATLLSKDPDDRYQSALALLGDLDRLDHEPFSDHVEIEIQNLASAQADQVFVGRKEQYKILEELWTQAKQKSGGIALVEAPSGMGKTKLIREIMKLASAESGTAILTGKCTQTGMATPFASLREAMEDFLKQKFQTSSDEIEFHQKIIKAIGPHATTLQNLFPSIAKNFAKDQKQKRIEQITMEQFYSALSEFLVGLGKSFEKVLIFIDDVQWLDEATMVLLKYFSQKITQTPIFLIVASRNDSDSQLAKDKFLQEVSSGLVSKIQLGPLNQTEMTDLASQYLGGKPVHQSVIKYLDVRAEGVPFAFIQFLKMMLKGGVLIPKMGLWNVDQERLNSLNLPENLFDLVLKRIDEITPETKTFLQFAALWGARFPVDVISKAAQFSSINRDNAIREALSSGLIEKQEESQQLCFVHDRVQEALQASIDPKLEKSFHRQIGRSIKDLNLQELYLYNQVEHLHRGFTQEDHKELIEVSAQAGHRALGEYAAQKAYEYFSWAQAGHQKFGSKLEKSCVRDFAQSAALTGKYEEALKLFSQFLEMETSPLERAKAHYELGRIANFRREIWQAWFHATKGLSELGFWYGDRPILNIFYIIGAFALGLIIDSLNLKWFRETKPETIEQLKVAAKISEMGGVASYFLNDPWKFTAIIGPSILTAARLPQCRELAFAQIAFATGMSVVGLNKLAFRYMERSRIVAANIEDPFLSARLALYRVFVLQFTNQWNRAREEVMNLIQNQAQFLDGQDLMNATYGGATCMTILSGHQRESKVSSIIAEDFLLRSETDLARRKGHPFLSTRIQIAAAAGEFNEAAEKIKLIQPQIEIKTGDKLGALGFYGSLLGYYYETREIGPLIENAIEQGLENVPTPEFLCMPHFRFFYVFSAYALLNRLILAHEGSSNTRQVRDLSKAIRRLNSVGVVGSWLPAQAHVYALRGALAHFQKQPALALKELARAQRMAEEYDLPLVQYEIHRWKAHALRSLEQNESALFNARIALEISNRMGWTVKSEWITKEFRVSKETVTVFNSETAQTTTGASQLEQSWTPSVQDLHRRKQFEALVNMSQASVGILDDKAQASRLLDEAIKYFSPERALLFLASDTDTRLQFLIGRNSLGQDITEAKELSQKALSAGALSEQPLIFTIDDGQNELSSESIVALNLRSVMVAPLIARKKLLGVLYLDNRVVRGIFRDSDRNFILSVAGLFAASLESARLTRIELERAELQRDLELTGAIQKLLLPQKDKIITSGITVTGFLQSATQSSGDLWWADELSPGKIFAFIGDVTGHGPGPAMVTATVAGAYQNFLAMLQLRSQKSSMHELIKEVSLFFKTVHESLQKTTRGDYLMPFTAALIDQSGELAIWGGGSPGIILKRNANSETEFLSSDGSPLGIGKHTELARHHLSDFKGQIVFYSDGLLENLNQKRNPEMYLNTLFSKCENSTIFLDTIKGKIPKTGATDDITILMIDINNSSENESSKDLKKSA